ncbi:hypothetical protein [Geomicrobium sp. JCM 19055]|uniref:phosphoribosylanthranilate isomerase n=1 Tax=Geomicrobium sp. JCM 19055 TaxID=1460649 RepID=UPI0006931CCB|nr:hypothetical protein [Geomicrobium sp. JCM 19055]
MSAYAPIVDGFIVDAGTKTERGGTGQTFDWKKAPTYIHFAKQLNVPLYIAGGVHEHNVQQLLEMQPDGIDVSSGIETEGKKRR